MRPANTHTPIAAATARPVATVVNDDDELLAAFGFAIVAVLKISSNTPCGLSCKTLTGCTVLLNHVRWTRFV